MKESSKSSSTSETWKGCFKPFNVFLGILIFCTFILVILNLKHYYREILVNESDVISISKTKTEKPIPVNTRLKPVRLDMLRFEIEVLKPHKEMKAKFSNHPDMVISKLSKILRKEENK